MRRLLSFSFSLALALVNVAHAGAQFLGPRSIDASTINSPLTLTTDPSILFPPQRDIRLAPGDLLAVSLYGSADYRTVDRVSLNGYLSLPLIGAVQVAGLSPHEAEKLIDNRLETQQFYRHPEVSVSVTESPTQIATVVGEAHGVVPLLVPKRLYDVLAAVGGLPPAASHVIAIRRPGLDQPIVVDLGNNPVESGLADVPIFPGDTIITSRPEPIYMIGAIRSQSVIYPSPAAPITLLQSMVMAGGPLFEAKLHDVYIIRTLSGKRTVVRADYSRILHGKDADPILLGDDIVVVPSSAVLAAIRSGGIGVLFSVVSTVSYIAFALSQ